MLLKAHMLYGKISYQPTDVVQREGEWHAGIYEADLMEPYRSSPEATVKFVTESSGAIRWVIIAKQTLW